MYAGSACAKLAVTTDTTNVSVGVHDDGLVIYCPMPFQPDTYTVCCLNAVDETRCCHADQVPATHQRLTYVSARLKQQIRVIFSIRKFSTRSFLIGLRLRCLRTIYM